MAARWPKIERQPSGTLFQVWFPPCGCRRGLRVSAGVGTTAEAAYQLLTPSLNKHSPPLLCARR